MFTLDGVKYHLMVDYFSKWVEVEKLSCNPTSSNIIEHCKSIFCRFGIPKTLFSDRESIYKSSEFDQFCKDFEIEKDFSSARYAQSNGQVERTIQNVKKMLKKCNNEGSDFKLALLEYHNTPLDASLGSPAIILMGRSLRTRLPCIDKKLINDNDSVNRKLLCNRQKASQKYFNKNVNPRKSELRLSPGDAVVFRDSLADKIWKQDKIIRIGSNPMSFDIKNSQGRILNRNSKMLLPDNTGRQLPRQLQDDPSCSNPATLTTFPEPVPGSNVREHSQLSPPSRLTTAPPIIRRSRRIASKQPVNYRHQM